MSVNVINIKGIYLFPANYLNPIISSWSFSQWEIDIFGPLSTKTTKKKLLLVAIDYFGKWLEIEAYVNIKDKGVTKFI